MSVCLLLQCFRIRRVINKACVIPVYDGNGRNIKMPNQFPDAITQSESPSNSQHAFSLNFELVRDFAVRPSSLRLLRGCETSYHMEATLKEDSRRTFVVGAARDTNHAFGTALLAGRHHCLFRIPGSFLAFAVVPPVGVDDDRTSRGRPSRLPSGH